MAKAKSGFPDTYSKIPDSELIEIYTAAPERLNQAMKGLSMQEIEAHPRAGKWSVKEITVHLAESEIMGAVRIRQAYCEPGSTFAVYEQDLWARESDYQGYDTKSFYSAIMLFDSLRLNTSKIFRKAKDSDWQKKAIHPEQGEISLRQLLEIYADHGERHIGQILELRKLLGKGLDLPLLLPRRLY